MNRVTAPKAQPAIRTVKGVPGIPRSGGSEARHIRASGGSEKINSNLKKRSPWYQSILNPAQGAGIKIPDDVAIQTGTIQCVTEENFIVSGAGNIGGVRIISLHPNLASPSLNGLGLNHQSVDPAGTSVSSVQWLQGSGFATTAPLTQFARTVRVVSAALYVESEASLASASGEMLVGYSPYTYTANGAPMSQFRNAYGTSIMPLNACKPMKVLWTPVSVDQQTYSAFYNPRATGIGAADTQVPLWELFVLVTGCPINTTFRVRMVVNYEFIPMENSIDIISANPSPCDSTEVDLTESWVAETQVTVPTSTKEMSSNPGAGIEASLPQDGGETGYGMFVDLLKELAPYALEGVAMLI